MKEIYINGKKIKPVTFNMNIDNKIFTITDCGHEIIINNESYYRGSRSSSYHNGDNIEIKDFKVFINRYPVPLGDGIFNLVGNGYENHIKIDGKEFTVKDCGREYKVNDKIIFKDIPCSICGWFGCIECVDGILVINDEPISFNGRISDYSTDDDDEYSEEICQDE